MSQPVRTEVHGRVLLITLDRPTANVIDVATSHALYDAFRELEDAPSLRVGVLTGAGSRFFSAGWDLHAAAGGEAVDADHGPGGFAGLTELFGRAKPVIAAVNGLALGGGLELALAADLIIMADHAEIALPEVRLGLVPDAGGALRLPARLPGSVAREMLLSGRRMGADEAGRWGLANQVVPYDDLMAASLDLAHRVSEAAPLAVAATLEILAATDALGVQESFDVQRSGRLPLYEAMLRSEDALEGPRAFAEGRAPNWQGR